MDLLLVLVAATAFPVACLGFVLWMGRMEDTLPASVARTLRRPDPEPVLRIPVRRPAPAARVPGGPVAAPIGAPVGAPGAGPVPGGLIPAQRTDPPAPAVPVATAVPSTPAGPAGT